MDVVTWPGWLGGIAVGVYMLAQLWLTGRALGASTGYGNLCALGSRASYFKTGAYADAFNWRFFFLIGIPLGGLLGLLLSPGATFQPTFALGPLYDSVLPDAAWLKALVLAAGGVAVGYGARMAGGCTSGHSITGIALLNRPSLVATVGFMVGGFVVVQALFRLLGAL